MKVVNTTVLIAALLCTSMQMIGMAGDNTDNNLNQQNQPYRNPMAVHLQQQAEALRASSNREENTQEEEPAPHQQQAENLEQIAQGLLAFDDLLEDSVILDSFVSPANHNNESNQAEK